MTNDFHIPPRRKLLWISVDLDGTLAYPTWKPDQKRSVIGDPIPANIAKLHAAFAAGYKPILNTARPWADYEMIEAWLEEHNIPIQRIICGKLLVHKYIDDHAIDAREPRWY